MRSMTMRRVVCAVLLGMGMAIPLYGMPVPSGGIVACPGGIVAGGGTGGDACNIRLCFAHIGSQVCPYQTLKYDLYFGDMGIVGGTLTPEARDNLRWAGISITVYCLLTHRLGM
jgi:hypothetical protein